MKNVEKTININKAYMSHLEVILNNIPFCDLEYSGSLYTEEEKFKYKVIINDNMRNLGKLLENNIYKLAYYSLFVDTSSRIYNSKCLVKDVPNLYIEVYIYKHLLLDNERLEDLTKILYNERILRKKLLRLTLSIDEYRNEKYFLYLSQVEVEMYIQYLISAVKIYNSLLYK